jgi:uncharacterized membrane protein
MAVDMLKELPRLVAGGLLSEEQAERIREHYRALAEKGGNRLLAVFAVLGCLLVGLGIILLVAHNWDDLGRAVRTSLAFAPMLLGIGLVLFTLSRRPESVVWREGSAVLLACGSCACVALISQIYHVNGELEDYLVTCSLLILPLLYLPASVMAALAYLAMVTWYAWLVKFDGWSTDIGPLRALPLLAVAVPAYLKLAKGQGTSIGFLWYGLFLALAVGSVSQMFYEGFAMAHVLALAGIASAFTLAPWLHHDRELRTHPWVFVGGTAMLILFCVLSFRDPWLELRREPFFGEHAQDLVPVITGIVTGLVAYVLSIKVRRPLAYWPYPEAPGLLAVCCGLAWIDVDLASITVNLSLLAMGALTVKRGVETDSLKRMNLGLVILGVTVLLRFFDGDMSFVVRGIAFILVGAGFLFMNLRMVEQRKRKQRAQ